MEHGIACFCGCHMVSLRTHATNARRNPGEFLDRSSDAELLEPAQLGNLEVRIGHFAVVIQKYVDLSVTFETRYWIDFDLPHDFSTLRRIE
jgi:hypothetical protein